MGWTKETTQPPPTRERWHLYYAHQAYISGRMGVEDLEASVEHVLKGGVLRQDGGIPTLDRPAAFETESIG
jgi:hypothetical protein